MIRVLSFTLNGQQQELTVEDTRKLLWVLRTDLGLTGTKFGCGQGLCGTCTIVVGRTAVRACQRSIGSVAGEEIRTIEGLGRPDALHPLQESFLAHQAFQCGFCTPGMLMAAYALLLNVPNPTASDVVEHLDRNLCRCGSHERIVPAVVAAATQGGERR